MPSMPEGHHLKLSVRKRQDFLTLSVSLSIIASVYPTLWQWHKLPAELPVLEMVWMKVVSESDHWVCWSFNNAIVWCEEKSFVGSSHWFNYNSIKVTSHKFILTKPCVLFIFTDGVMPSHPLGLLLCIFQCGSEHAVSYKGLRDEATEQSLQNQKLFYMLSASGRVCRSVTE